MKREALMTATPDNSEMFRESTHTSLTSSLGSNDSDVSDTTQSPKENLPPMESLEFEEEVSIGGGRLRLRRPSFRDVTPRDFVWYLLVLFVGQLLLASCLHKAGVTDRDLFEELVARSVLQNGWSRINGSISVAYLAQEKMRPGYHLAQKGARATYPIVMVPGFVTSGLELWGGEECARKHFRQRLWGALGTARTFFTDRDCFLRHLALDPYTGGDPPNIRLRAAQGFEAADYFMATYWVWEKLINNLADVGYDQSNMVMMSYDWRLAFPLLEERDGYLTKLRYNIEAMHKSSGKKVVLATHSMGALLTLYFLNWVTKEEHLGGGGGGPTWVDAHIHAFVNIAGPTLGVPKAVPALLSGEFKDTSTLLGTIGSMVEHFFGRRLRKSLWITWGSLWAMLPTGGDAIWGTGADICNAGSVMEQLRCRQVEVEQLNHTVPASNAPFLEMTDRVSPNEKGGVKKNSVEKPGEQVCSSSDLLGREQHKSSPSSKRKLHRKALDFISSSAKSMDETIEFLVRWGGGYGNLLSNAKWHHSMNEKKSGSEKMIRYDPTTTPLPYAPSLKIYCMYGVGLKTERAYFYKQSEIGEEAANTDDSTPPQCRNTKNIDVDLPFVMDTAVEDPDQDIVHGVRLVDGDGSVPLLSLGYMCVDAWSTRRENDDSTLNPSKSEVITREYAHNPEFHVDDPMRGGPASAEHVDILGNVDMTQDFLRIVTHFEQSKVKTRLQSDIERISQRVNEKKSRFQQGTEKKNFFLKYFNR